MVIQTWINTLAGALQQTWMRMLSFLPALIGAIVVLIVGAIVSSGLEKLVERIVYHLRIDTLLRQLGVESYLERGGVRLDAGVFLGRVVYWFFIIVFFLAASDILGFTSVSAFLTDVLNYIPNVLVASLILVASLVAAHFVRGLVRSSVMSANLHAGKALGTIAWWGVAVFGFLTALVQLGVAVTVINTLITGLVAMLALAGGLAFGLGGREHAASWLSKMRDEMSHRGR
jgi:hypothetical protein